MIRIAWAPIYHHPVPENHRFPMAKYSLLPQQLRLEGTAEPEQFFAPEPLEVARIIRTHDPSYWAQLEELTLPPRAQRKIGFQLNAQLVERERMICQGTIDCARYALQHGCALNIAGGTHHAFYDRGEGFCLLNDLVLAAHMLLDEGHVERILVVDLDVHQGNGTAALCADLPQIFTFSMHGANNYPYHKEQSDLDIALPDLTTGATYLALLEEHLEAIFCTFKPQFVLFQSGVDVLEGDKLGRFSLTMEDCKKRDELVFSRCERAGIPIVAAMGGGYSPAIKTVIEAHANTFRAAAKYYF